MEKLVLQQSDKDLLRLGYPPEQPEVLDAMTVGQSAWEAFVLDQYLKPGGYIASGYSQMKFILGRPGAGKTHLLRCLSQQAVRLGYVAAYIRASDIRFQHIDSTYAAIAQRVDMDELARRLAHRVVEKLGYDLDQVPANRTFLSWVVQERQRIDTLVKRDVEQILGDLFKRERVDPNFSLAFTQLASAILGIRYLSREDRDLLLRWLRGEKLRAIELHRICLARGIDRYNARDTLHALADFVRQQGFIGLFVTIDQMEDLPLGRNPETQRLKYGNAALADAYQSLREMVDDLPSVPGMMIVLAGQRDFLELPRGIKSYDALWLRIQHEVISSRFNRFGQLVDLDRAVAGNLKPEDARLLHEHLTALGMETRPFDEVRVRSVMAMLAGDGVYRRLMNEILADNPARG
jgi:hypothetical protein